MSAALKPRKRPPGRLVKTLQLSIPLSLSLCSHAASDPITPVERPTVYWIGGRWQTWNNGAWTPYSQKPAAKSDNPEHGRKGSVGYSNQLSRITRTQKATTQKSAELHSVRDSKSGPAQGLPIGAPNSAIGKPNVAIGQPTIAIGQPMMGIGQPTIGIGQPTIGMGQSTTGMGQATVGIGQPMKGLGQNTTAIGQPTSGIGQRNGGIGQTTIGIGQPTIGIGKPAIGIGKPEPPKPRLRPRINRPEPNEKTNNPQF